MDPHHDHEPGPAPEGTDEVRLTLPALVPYARVARLALAGLASRNGFSYDEVEDVRIAIGEVFAVLVDDSSPTDRPPADRLRFTSRVHPETLEVVAERQPPEAISLPSAMSEQILDAVVDSWEVDVAVGEIRITKWATG